MRYLLVAVLLLGACKSGEDPTDLGIDTDGGQLPDDGGQLLGDGGDSDAAPIEGDGGMPLPLDGGTGLVACGMTPCNVAGGNVCCNSFTMGMFTSTCVAPAMCMMGAPRACDGPEDCPMATPRCCAAFSGATSCAADCPAFQNPTCHDKTQCPTPGNANLVAACCPVTQTLRTCRNLPPMFVPMNCN